MLSASSGKPARAGLVLVMVLCSLMLWLGSPVIWLWIGSQTTSSQSPGMGPYFLVAMGIIASTVAIALALSRLNRAYERVTGRVNTIPFRLPWLRSLRDDRGTREVTVLDFILVSSALLAFVTFGVWFLFLAGSSLPG